MEVLNNVLTFAGVIAFIVSIFVQVIKNIVNMPKNLIPVLGIVVGVIIGALSTPFTDLDLTLRLWAGIFAGFSATGLYELVTSRSGNTKEDKNTDINNKI